MPCLLPSCFTYVLPTSQNSFRWSPSWLSNARNSRKDPESEWLARNQLHYCKTQDGSHVAEQSSLVPLSCCSPRGCLFAIKSLALSAPVSPWTIQLQVLDKGPLSCPGRGPPSWSIPIKSYLGIIITEQNISVIKYSLPRWLSGKEPACQYRKWRFDLWIGKMSWKRKWQPTPVFLPGKSHGQKSLLGYSPGGCKELDTTERLCVHEKWAT